MCLLVVLRGYHESHPVLVAANRDERRDRKAGPPGLFIGERHRVLAPRDRQAGGTWLGVNDRGAFAGLTNITGAPVPPGAPSRGSLPHLALDQDDLDAASAAVAAEVSARAYGGFQLVLASGRRTRVLRHEAGRLEVLDWPESVLIVSNEHRPGELSLPLLRGALGTFAAAQERLDALRPVLLDEGGGHPVLKRGEVYGTVSSSLIAVPAADPRELIWLYAAGSPDAVPYRNYGNLGRRLLPE
jgi:hypothetical protein